MFNQGNQGTIVLMYHGIESPAPHGEMHYTVTKDRFAEQLALLRHRPVVPFQDLVAGRAAPGSVVLTFDDGERSILTHAFPQMKAQGFRGTVFVTTSWIGTEGYLNAEDLCQLQEAGWTIGAHGKTHRFLSDLSDDLLKAELVASRLDLAQILNQQPVHMSLPGGRCDARVLTGVRSAGYLSLSTSKIGVNPTPPDLYSIRRMMVLHSWDTTEFHSIVNGDRLSYLRLEARQALLDAAKSALGNERYVKLRATLFQGLKKLSQSGHKNKTPHND